LGLAPRSQLSFEPEGLYLGFTPYSIDIAGSVERRSDLFPGFRFRFAVEAPLIPYLMKSIF
jgi:hypothetical protein